VIRTAARRLSRCPAPGRALSFGALLGALAACAYIPRPVEGVPPGAPWAALPLRSFLAEDRAEPEAMAICRPPECSPGLAVAVVRLRGRAAEEAEAVLRQPDRLARALEEPGGKARKVQSSATVSPVDEEGYRGFALTLGRRDGSKRPAYGEALGRRIGAELRVVLVIGESPESVDATARRVAREHLGA
jgi:hypothetical protein